MKAQSLKKIRLYDLLKKKDFQALSQIKKQIINSKTALASTEACANDYLNRASSEISFLNQSRYKMALLTIVQYVKKRAFKESSIPVS